MAEGTGRGNPSVFEYTLQDYRVVAVKPEGGRFPFADRLEEITYGDKGESKTVQGSNSSPRAHTRVLLKPTAELSMDVDTATRFQKFASKEFRGTRVAIPVRLILARQTPDGPTVIDVVQSWLPVFDNTTAKSGDASPVKVTGNALKVVRDTEEKLS